MMDLTCEGWMIWKKIKKCGFLWIKGIFEKDMASGIFVSRCVENLNAWFFDCDKHYLMATLFVLLSVYAVTSPLGMIDTGLYAKYIMLC